MATLDQQSVKKTSGSDGACTAFTTASVYTQPGVVVGLSVSMLNLSCVQKLHFHSDGIIDLQSY